MSEVARLADGDRLIGAHSLVHAPPREQRVRIATAQPPEASYNSLPRSMLKKRGALSRCGTVGVRTALWPLRSLTEQPLIGSWLLGPGCRRACVGEGSIWSVDR